MNIGSVHVNSGEFLPYLAVAYAVFFLVIFAYMISLAHRQDRVQSDLAVLRRALDEVAARARPSSGAGGSRSSND